MLSRLAYLTLCRSFQLLALLARGDAAKDLEILWSACPVGSLRARMRADLEAVLAGWRRDPNTRRGGRAP